MTRPSKPNYRGRFAPSPTGPLHAGSLVAALASWLDARAHGGTWIVRMEDVDEPRCSRANGDEILRQLAVFGLTSDEPVVWQSSRKARYHAALDRLIAADRAYGCICSRADIAAWYAARGIDKPRFGEWVYPGTCRERPVSAQEGSWRFKTEFLESNRHHVGDSRTSLAINKVATVLQSDQINQSPDTLVWHDRRLGEQRQNVAQEVGDFVVKRADGFFAYQLAVVVDDADQGITHVVRGEDLADNTARQIAVQRALGLPLLEYLHTPLVLAADGHKLSKQNGAVALDESAPAQTLSRALTYLQLNVMQSTLTAMLSDASAQWAQTFHCSRPQ